MTKDKQIEILKQCFESTIWMAIRYADRRKTYAPSMVRDAVEKFKQVFPEWKLQRDDTIKPPDYEGDFNGVNFRSDYLYDLFETQKSGDDN